MQKVIGKLQSQSDSIPSAGESTYQQKRVAESPKTFIFEAPASKLRFGRKLSWKKTSYIEVDFGPFAQHTRPDDGIRTWMQALMLKAFCVNHVILCA